MLVGSPFPFASERKRPDPAREEDLSQARRIPGSGQQQPPGIELAVI